MVLGISSGVPLVLPAHFVPGFHCGLLRYVAAQLFAQFPCVVRIYLRIVAPA
jgi:hypothetical protein